MSNDKTKETAPKRVTVKLLAEHTHAGEEKKPGDKIELREDQAKRLIDAKRAEAA